ncbi:MAG: DUF92 domain-containing protein [Ktedonobacteraceae bacterium]
MSQASTPSKKILQRTLLGLLLSSGVGLLAYRRRSLNRSGVAGAIITGTTTVGLGGWAWGLSLIFFFVSSSLLSHFRERDKAALAEDKFSKGSERDIFQVAANGGIATLLTLGYGLSTSSTVRSACEAGYLGAFATATADTWATELGTLSTQSPRLITTGKPTTPGTSGGITTLGTSVAAAGATALGLFYTLLQGQCHRTLSLVALISGLAGSLFDSFLGATVQAMYYCPACKKETERHMHNCGTQTVPLRGISWVNNDVVNFLATLFGAVVAMGVNALLQCAMQIARSLKFHITFGMVISR